MAARVGLAGGHDVGLPATPSVRSSSLAVDVLARHGRSFHWASRLLSRDHARDAATLYAFCRHADDLVDESSAAEGSAAIAVLRRQLASVKDVPIAAPKLDVHDPVAAFWELMQRRRIDPAVVDILLSTLEQDIGRVRMRSIGDLLRYSYGVASTVGLMMCDVLGCDDGRAHPFAIDLGIAMQLTNIARDVLEDARRERIYIPLPADVQPEHLVAGQEHARGRALITIQGVLDLAARYYRSADHGLCYLPLQARAAILAASRIYEGIGAVIRRHRQNYWQQRWHVAGAGKAWHTVRAGTSLAFGARYWRPRAAHDSALHGSLLGLPGVAQP